MFSIFSKKRQFYKDRFSFISIDIHNHILPGIDDGSEDEATSLLLLNGLLELGIKKVVSTPHIISALYPNNFETISLSYKKIMDLPDFPLEKSDFKFAAEYMVDYEFEDKIQHEPILSFGADKYVLLEMSYLVESPNFRNVLFFLLTKGFQPILAHPERYGFYHHKIDYYEQLVDAGCQLQLNLLSLAGHYGKQVQTISEKLLKANLYTWVGTDMHHTTHLSMLQQMASNDKLIRKLELIKDLKNQYVTI
jgi:protein-tyrosine phosphatase